MCPLPSECLKKHIANTNFTTLLGLDHFLQKINLTKFDFFLYLFNLGLKPVANRKDLSSTFIIMTTRRTEME